MPLVIHQHLPLNQVAYVTILFSSSHPVSGRDFKFRLPFNSLLIKFSFGGRFRGISFIWKDFPQARQDTTTPHSPITYPYPYPYPIFLILQNYEPIPFWTLGLFASPFDVFISLFSLCFLLFLLPLASDNGQWNFNCLPGLIDWLNDWLTEWPNKISHMSVLRVCVGARAPMWVCTVCECVSEGVCVCTTFVSNNYVPSGTHSSGSTFSPSSSWPTHTHSLTHSHSHNSSWKWGLFKCCLSAWLENGYLPVRGKEGEESGGGLARNECKRHVGKAHRRSDSTHLPPTTQHPHTHYPPSSPHCVHVVK